VLERIGRSGDIRTERELLVRESGIPVAFSEKALLEAERIEELPDGAKNRHDIGRLTVITIDGADAKDLDDAISLERLPDGNSELGVHIADVAEYVREGSELDREAIRRGTSCYLSDRVIPMLPEKLSNDLCSLHPGGKKFCLSIFLKIAKDGRVLDRRVEETVIHSARRCTYDEVQSWQDADGAYPLPEPNVLELVRSLFDLVRGIDTRREAEGRIDFEIPELKVVLDDQGEPERVAERDRKASHRLIETLMVLANEEISAYFSKITPFVFRVHEPPSPESQGELRELFATYGIRFKGMEIRPKDLQEAYLALKAKTGVPPIEKLLLSKLSKARYSELPLGHYGLSLSFYSHFTSPIRRYPDLQIHRIIKECLREKLSAERKKHYAAILPGGAKRASENERRAEGLERAVESFDAARYMERHVGETFSAIVVGKSKFAYYVKLENGIEGAVYLGKTSRGKTPDFPDFGTPIQVKLTSVERAYGRIDFEPVK
jgi:ribonuclease R